MKQAWILGISVFAATAFFAGAVQTADARTRQDRQSGMQEDQPSHRSSDWQKISGTVKRTKNVELKGTDQENLVVQIQTRQGRRTIVDLGNAEHLEDLDLQRGDRITAWGRPVDIGDKQVLMAHKLRANDETIEIERHEMSRQETNRMGRDGQSQSSRSRSGRSGEDRAAHSRGFDQGY